MAIVIAVVDPSRIEQQTSVRQCGSVPEWECKEIVVMVEPNYKEKENGDENYHEFGKWTFWNGKQFVTVKWTTEMNLWGCGVNVRVLKYKNWLKNWGEIIVFWWGYNNSNANESISRIHNNILL